eukprot:scaffold188387_cov16-Tisochrysis_lutea.AAC.1
MGMLSCSRIDVTAAHLSLQDAVLELPGMSVASLAAGTIFTVFTACYKFHCLLQVLWMEPCLLASNVAAASWLNVHAVGRGP